jgi:hypothetical protein
MDWAKIYNLVIGHLIVRHMKHSLPRIAAELRLHSLMGPAYHLGDDLCLICPGMQICGEALAKQADCCS